MFTSMRTFRRVTRFLFCAAAMSVLETGAGPTAVMASPPPAPDALTENSAAQWTAGAQGATASVDDNTSRYLTGSASIHFTTDGGFDTWLASPPGRNASWDLSTSGGIEFQVYAVNHNNGFQDGSPWIRFHSSETDHLELRTDNTLLNSARDHWITVRVPVAGGPGWIRTVTGSPDLADIDWIEIHSDTWEYGFELWIDGLRFDLPLVPQRVRAFAGNHKVSLQWEAVQVSGGQFSHYAVYRQIAPFSNVSSLTPIQTLPGASTTSWEDLSALNGTSYHYAVTAVLMGGLEAETVESVGPRTPFDETDLQVTCVARTPRYPRFNVTYTYHDIVEPSGYGPYQFSAATGLGGGQTPATQRWPGVGNPVTWTATVRNRGSNVWTGSLAATWRVDGVIVGSPSQPVNLQPGQTATFALVRTWDDQLHDIRFDVEVNDARDGNDRLTVQTKSAAFLSYIDRTRMEEFREETPAYSGATTDDFVDWLNQHMLRFNQLIQAASVSKRVHFDVLEVIDDDLPDPSVDLQPFAVFPFRYHLGEGSLRLSGFYDSSEDLDYGLLHEMGHQLGLIDLYRLNVSPGQNQVSGLGYSTSECLMNGCSHFLSTSSADAMTHWLHTAHGYFGQYLYAIPAQVRMRFLGQDGEPLENAQITVYQKAERSGIGDVITPQVKAAGTTDGAGIYTLPNVAINTNLVPPTFAGDTLRANPFGYVAVIGGNGVLHFKIEHEKAVDYAWLDITETNAAYRSGQTSQATFTRELALGGPIQFVPPVDMAELNESSWTRWTEDGTISLFDDSNRVRNGAASIRIEATGGFDNYWRYPGDQTARWDLTGSDTLHVSFYAENPSPSGFQNRSPWIFLRSANGSIELHPTSDLLNSARGQWLDLSIPLDGNSTWERTALGTPDMTRITGLEIHADTWDAGFTLWMDGVRFDPMPVSDTELAEILPTRLSVATSPNPFRFATTIRFDLPVDGQVEISIFDAKGRLVRALESGVRYKGPQFVQWNGLDGQQRNAPNGVYFVQLVTCGESMTRKILKQK